MEYSLDKLSLVPDMHIFSLPMCHLGLKGASRSSLQPDNMTKFVPVIGILATDGIIRIASYGWCFLLHEFVKGIYSAL